MNVFAFECLCYTQPTCKSANGMQLCSSPSSYDMIILFPSANNAGMKYRHHKYKYSQRGSECSGGLNMGNQNLCCSI